MMAGLEIEEAFGYTPEGLKHSDRAPADPNHSDLADALTVPKEQEQMAHATQSQAGAPVTPVSPVAPVTRVTPGQTPSSPGSGSDTRGKEKSSGDLTAQRTASDKVRSEGL